MSSPGPVPVVLKTKFQRVVKKLIRTRRRGATSNYYLHMALKKGIENLSKDELDEIALLVKHTHRIKPVAKSKARQGSTVFNSTTGHHEWLPTDRAEQILKSSIVWNGLFTSLRSPTWLLVVSPGRYCADKAEYVKALQAAAGHVLAKDGKTIAASTLGLVGHSGGLNNKGTQLTQFQSTWHDELRDLWDRHAPTNAYDAYWSDLWNFITDTFLFVSAPTLPPCGADLQGASMDDVMKAITWDLEISCRGGPEGTKIETLYDVAQFLNGHWAGWGRALHNSFNAWRGFAI